MGRLPKPVEVRVAFFTARASGATLKQAAAAAGISRTAGHYWLAQSGGVRPRRRSPRPALRLSLDEREAISRGLAQRKTLTAIAAEIGRSVSTVSREVARNSGPNGYRAARADRLATAARRAPARGSSPTTPALRAWVEDKLAQYWSPRQISRRLVMEFPDDAAMRVCHETIYTSLFVHSKRTLGGELTRCLRTGRVRRRPRRRVSAAVRRAEVFDRLSIHDRPAAVLDRTVAGHWEGDLLVGRYGRSHIATLVERRSRYLLALPLPDATSPTVVAVLAAAFAGLPGPLRRTLTWDRGMEMTRHAEFSVLSGMPVYFCDAYSPWQRGSNENTNGLLRQYFPKKSDLSLTSPEQLLEIVQELNNRPRQALGWKTPTEVLHGTGVAMTA
jgi:IS30 family transposase